MNSAYSRLRSTLLGSVAASIVVMAAASSAHAQAPGIAPSIEIHADVIESLRQDALVRAQAAPAPQTAPAPMREEVIRQKLKDDAARQPVNRAPLAMPAPAAEPAPTVTAPARNEATRWGAPAGVEMTPPPGAVVTSAPEPRYVAPRAETVPPREAAAPREHAVVPAVPEVTPQERAAAMWAQRYPVPAHKPQPPVVVAPKSEAPKPVAPMPVAPEPVANERQAVIPLPAMESIPELPAAPEPIKELPKPAAKAPVKLPEPVAIPSAKKAAVNVPAPMEMPALEPLPEPKVAAPAPIAPAPITLPPIKELAKEPVKAPIKELPPLPLEKAPAEKAAPLAPLNLPPVPVEKVPAPKVEIPVPALPEAQENEKALQPPASVQAAQSGEGYGLMDDIKRLGRKMLGKEPEPLKPITTPIPVPTLPDAQVEQKSSLKSMPAPVTADAGLPALPDMPNVQMDKPEKLPAPVAIPPVKFEPRKLTATEKKAEEALQKSEEASKRAGEELAKKHAAEEKAAKKEAEAQAKAEQEAAKKEAAEKVKADKEAAKLAKAEAKKAAAEKKLPAKLDEAEEMAPLVLPPLPSENAKAPSKADAPIAKPSELEPTPELAALPPLPSEKDAAKDEPMKELPKIDAKEAPKAAKPDPLAGLPPISSLDDETIKHAQAVPVAPVASKAPEKLLPPLPPLEKLDSKKAAAPEAPAKAEAAKKEVKAPKGEVRSVKPTPVTEVGGAELPPLMDLPPLPSETASPLAPAKGPAPKSDALELIEKDGKKVAPEPLKELAALPAELPPLPALPDEPASKSAKSTAAEKPAASSGAGTRVVFKKDALDIPAGSEGSLKSFAAQVVANPGKRVVIASYASGKGDEQARAARKIALSRGLKVRSYLIDQGVDALRINVSSKMDEGASNPDRVEVSLQ